VIRSRWQFALGVCLFAVCASTASAQTITVPTRLSVGCGLILPTEKQKDNAGKDVDVPPVTTLTNLYLQADGVKFHAKVDVILKAIKDGCKKKDARNQSVDLGIDLKTDAIVLVWADKSPSRDGQAVYHTVLVAGSTDASNTTLPGVGHGAGQAFEIFLSSEEEDAIATVYTSTRQRNPIEEQLPALAQAITGPLFGLLGSTQNAIRIKHLQPAPPAPPNIYATVSSIPLPFDRATIQVKAIVAKALTSKAAHKQAADLTAELEFTVAGRADCVSDYVKAIQTELAKPTNLTDQCLGDGDCAAKAEAGFKKASEDALKACGTNTAQLKLLAETDKKLRDFMIGLDGKKVTDDFALQNTPLTLVSLGLMTGLTVSGRVDGTRVKLDDNGKIAADPLGRVMALVVVNVGFTKYDAGTFHMTPAERYRWFAGAIVAPDFGVAGGLTFGIVRGLGVNLGGGVVGVRGQRSADSIGEPPTNPSRPFTLTPAYVGFVGVSYNFK